MQENKPSDIFSDDYWVDELTYTIIEYIKSIFGFCVSMAQALNYGGFYVEHISWRCVIEASLASESRKRYNYCTSYFIGVGSYPS